MLKRPKPGEDEEDILRMQEEFIREKNKNQNLQPAAQVVNLRNLHRNEDKKPKEKGSRKPSKYAQAKGLQGHLDKRVRFDDSTSCVSEIVEKNTEGEPVETANIENDDDKVYFPKVLPSLLGNIVEKNVDDIASTPEFLMPSTGFPVVTKYDKRIRGGKKSIHLQDLERQKKLRNEIKTLSMAVDEVVSDESVSLNPIQSQYLNVPNKSYIITSSDAAAIHKENVEILSKMSEQEILQEKQKLLNSLDPTLIKFIQAKRNATESIKQTEAIKKHENPETTDERMDTSDAAEQIIHDDTLWDNDFFAHPNMKEWLHFDSLEKDKLEWMKGIKDSKKTDANEPYEARFDFRGYLLPYTMEYTEKTKPLFHHGEEPHRPGYSFSELFELSRSSVMQQRVMAVSTIAGILEYYMSGIYKDIIDIPLSKILFVIRFALDENIVIILEPALKAMRNLLYNRIDEACLDMMVGSKSGNQQPCLENDKSAISELESQESELKDFHLAEIDIITACLRTDILQRLYYILFKIRPSFHCVHYSLQILTRIVRDSTDTAMKIVQMDHLMDVIIQNFVPNTSINFNFDPNIVYNRKPILAALKFIRVLSLQSENISNILVTKYNLLNIMSSYISSLVNGTYGLRIQIEAFCILSNCLYYNIGIDNALSLCPILTTTLYKHVEGTNLNSGIVVIHAAMLLQLINSLLGIAESVQIPRNKIYPLVRDGVYKWVTQFGKRDTYTYDDMKLVSSVLDCTKTILVSEKNVPVNDLIITLNMVCDSKIITTIETEFSTSSNLLSKIEKNQLLSNKNLISLNSIAIDSTQKVLPILNKNSPFILFTSIINLLDVLKHSDTSKKFLQKLYKYLNRIRIETPSLCDNWFTRIETDFIFIVLKVAIGQDLIHECDKDMIYTIANKLCYILRADKTCDLEFLFNNIVFNKNWFTTDRLMSFLNLSDLDTFCAGNIQSCYKQFINLKHINMGANVILRIWQEPVLPRDWIYLPILSLYSQSQELKPTHKTFKTQSDCQDADRCNEISPVVKSSLEWILFNEICFSDLIDDINLTDRFCRIMCVFLCDTSLFLESKIKVLLHDCIQLLFKKEKRTGFDFEKNLVGLHNFQDFYTQFLEQFQSVSYGDHNFAACVLVPLAQKHNNKWRKLLWSEYAGCLRALDCPENMLCYDINDYLYPEETDDSLIKCYFQALSSNLVRPGTISYKIASHHVQCYKNRSKKA